MVTSGREQGERTRIVPVLADEIAALVAADGLANGTHLRTGALADRFQVSRWPVEQALKTLVESGLVEHRPSRGFFVADADRAASRDTGPPDAVHAAYLAVARDLVDGAIERQVTEQLVRERYSLSRRQAADLLARMANEGLAEKRVGYGWSFSGALTTPQALEQTYQLRLMIEPQNLLLPGYRLPEDEIARLRRTEEELLAGGIERLAPDALYERATRFHESLIEASGNPFLFETLRRVNRVRRLLTYQSMQDRSRYHAQSREHLAILDRIEAGQMEAAARLMRDHLTTVVRSMRAIGILNASEEETPR